MAKVTKTAQIIKGTYMKDMEEKKCFFVVHPDHNDKIYLLPKKNDNGERMTYKEFGRYMLGFDMSDLVKRLKFVVNEEYGDYFVIDLMDYSEVDWSEFEEEEEE